MKVIEMGFNKARLELKPKSELINIILELESERDIYKKRLETYHKEPYILPKRSKPRTSRYDDEEILRLYIDEGKNVNKLVEEHNNNCDEEDRWVTTTVKQRLIKLGVYRGNNSNTKDYYDKINKEKEKEREEKRILKEKELTEEKKEDDNKYKFLFNYDEELPYKYRLKPDGDLFDGAEMILKKLDEIYLPQYRLAEAIGMNQSKLSDLLHGRIRPTKGELQKIAVTLDIDMSEWKRQSGYIRSLFPSLGKKGFD